MTTTDIRERCCHPACASEATTSIVDPSLPAPDSETFSCSRGDHLDYLGARDDGTVVTPLAS